MKCIKLISKFYFLLFIATLFVNSLTSCKKELQNKNELGVPKNDKNYISMSQLMNFEEIDYNEMIIQNANNSKSERLLLPVKQKQGESFFKYILVERKSGTPAIDRAFVISRYKINSNANLFLFKLKNYDLIYYNSQTQLPFSCKLESKNREISSTGNQKSTATPDYVAPAAPYCIDHWWVTYDETGKIITVDYLGYSCYSSGGGGTPGNNPSPASSACLNDLKSVVDNTNSASTLGNIQDISQTTTNRAKMYSWKCVTAPSWDIISYEKGIHKKISTTKPTLQWQWQSLTHQSISLNGFILGGTVSPTLNYANSILGQYNSTMNIGINLKFTISRQGVSCDTYKNMSSSITFNVNSSAMPGY